MNKSKDFLFIYYFSNSISLNINVPSITKSQKENHKITQPGMSFPKMLVIIVLLYACYQLFLPFYIHVLLPNTDGATGKHQLCGWYAPIVLTVKHLAIHYQD